MVVVVIARGSDDGRMMDVFDLFLPVHILVVEVVMEVVLEVGLVVNSTTIRSR